MKLSNTKWIEAISTLNELTQTHRLKWSVSKTAAIGSRYGGGLMSIGGVTESEPVGASFIAPYQDKFLRLTKFQVTSSGGGSTAGLLGIAGNYIDYRLDILDSAGTELFSVPETSGLADLYKSIQYQVTDVDGLLNSLLKEPLP